MSVALPNLTADPLTPAEVAERAELLTMYLHRIPTDAEVYGDWNQGHLWNARKVREDCERERPALLAAEAAELVTVTARAGAGAWLDYDERQMLALGRGPRVLSEWFPGPDGLHGAALDYARNGWRVLPLDGKRPMLRHGVLDATDDLAKVDSWWTRCPDANIGAVVPPGLLVLDIDPRNGGSRAGLESVLGPLPPTLTTLSGGDYEGQHLWYQRPSGPLSGHRLIGVDLLLSGKYAVMPPSVHPASGSPYLDIGERDAVALPALARARLRAPRPVPVAPRPPSAVNLHGDSIADAYTTGTSWAQVLSPHGWTCASSDGDGDGARWRHPTATSDCSATVRHGCLFVYSTSTPLPVTEVGSPHGLTRFRAYAILDHNGDMQAAARVLRARTVTV